MIVLRYDSVKELMEEWVKVTTFESMNKQMVGTLVDLIEEGLRLNKESITVFSIYVRGEEEYMLVDIPKSEWTKVTKMCLEFYEREGTVDERLDTWELLQKVNSRK